ncbi:tetratricopeptide repeat protein [Thermaurantimonas aggregans]|uniref:tetratricopeptide repeat protein n=1 Tax=Thermaurantimonas aggregans TaxID=2173829 RepID=UPI0023F475BF|nr:tetratricopeptide repeat protein [Thermaurantimonas aggregans]MCX8147707.1 tetratricopeptide repeat protein [Thermaurantimonas aggregans]
MRKTIILLFVAAGFASVAQIGPTVSSAVIALERRNDLADAKRNIDNATAKLKEVGTSGIKPKDLAKYYYYNGKIHLEIYQSQNQAISSLEPNALDIAAENLKNNLEYEKSINKKFFSEQAVADMYTVINLIQRRGEKNARNEKLEEAYKDFMLSFELGKSPGIDIIDTVMLYNAALMKFNAKDFPEAIRLFNQLLQLNYKGVQYFAYDNEQKREVQFGSPKELQRNIKLRPDRFTNPREEGDIRPDLYIMLAVAYKSINDQENYVAILKKARAEYPNEERFIREELDSYIKTKQYDKAVANLKLSLQNEPNNKLFWFILGTIYHTEMNDLKQAEEAYDKALAIDENYADVLYMKGLIYITKANDLVEQMNKLSFNETKKFEKLKSQQLDLFRQALPLFEKAHQINPKDKDTIKALREVYYKLGNTQKALEMDKLLQQG